MVVASPQPNEPEQKKKRQTLERAKASHLSKQLQMRLQYAKLKVEYGWQRQNLNEVENLYFHHSHLRHLRQAQDASGAGPHPPAHSDTPVVLHSPAPDHPVGHGLWPSSTNDAPESLPPLPQPTCEHAPGIDGPLSSQPQASPRLPTASAVTATSTMSRPPSAFDLSDPNILARLAQPQVHAQSSQPLSRLPTTVAPSTSTSLSTPAPAAVSFPLPAPTPSPTCSPDAQPPQPAQHPHACGNALLSSYPTPLPFFSTPTGPLPVLPVPVTTATPVSMSVPPLIPAPHNPVPTMMASQSPAPTIPATTPSTSALASALIHTTQVPIAPIALTYDSFWSTHASSSGATRALYRTHTGFSASATPAGNVAMLTPGGHAAVMTAEGLYVGGGATKSS